MGLSPMLEHRQMGVVKFTTFCHRLIIGVGHVTYEEVEQGIFVLVCETTISITPFTIVLVETTIHLTANHCVVRQRHSTTLAVQSLG